MNGTLGYLPTELEKEIRWLAGALIRRREGSVGELFSYDCFGGGDSLFQSHIG
jgi:hypothetical protein